MKQIRSSGPVGGTGAAPATTHRAGRPLGIPGRPAGGLSAPAAAHRDTSKPPRVGALKLAPCPITGQTVLQQPCGLPGGFEWLRLVSYPSDINQTSTSEATGSHGCCDSTTWCFLTFTAQQNSPHTRSLSKCTQSPQSCLSSSGKPCYDVQQSRRITQSIFRALFRGEMGPFPKCGS